jgi:molybdopterin-guanine dinucleotide biosynthesis protein A
VTWCGGIVLAGGRSSRMGTPKALLDWHGRPLLVHVTEQLQAALGAGAPVVVVRAPGQELPGLPPGVELAADAATGRGPLQGLAAGLAALEGRAEAAVVVATDQPFAAAAVPRLLAALTDGHDAVAFAGAPLGAIYRPSLRAAAEARLAAGDDLSLRGLLGAARTRLLPPDAAIAAALRSLDTPEAYAEALRLGPRGSGPRP